MKIIVQNRTGAGRCHEFTVEPTTTVGQLKEKIQAKLNFSASVAQKLALSFDDDNVDNDNEQLSSYGISDGSELTLYDASGLSKAISGVGMKFIDVSNSNNLQRIQFAREAPLWRRVRGGLCLEGDCTNTNCPANGQCVIIPVGYKTFDLLLDIDKTTTACPICKEFVTPQNCGFSGCWWRYQGRMLNNANGKAPPEDCSCDWTQVGSEYVRFDPRNTNSVTWLKLVFEVAKKKPTE